MLLKYRVEMWYTLSFSDLEKLELFIHLGTILINNGGGVVFELGVIQESSRITPNVSEFI